MTNWTDTYVGLPYQEHGRTRDGADCWGLACVVYSEQLGITLPDYLGYSSVEERAEIAALVKGATASPLWEPATNPAVFDIALFRRGRLTSHVGIVIRPGLMLHMAEADCALIEDYTRGHWASRLVGHYRHVEMASKVFQ